MASMTPHGGRRVAGVTAVHYSGPVLVRWVPGVPWSSGGSRPRPPMWRPGGRGDDDGVVVPPSHPSAVQAVPTGAAYSVLLLCHVASAVVGFGALAVTGVQARRARRGPSGVGSDGVRRYFRPGVNWAARALYGVPVFGFALVASSRGAFAVGDGFVVAGLALWLAATAVAEAVVWPGERRIQEVVSSRWGTGAGETTGSDRRFDLDCRRVAAAAALLSAVFVVAVVLMVAQP